MADLHTSSTESASKRASVVADVPGFFTTNRHTGQSPNSKIKKLPVSIFDFKRNIFYMTVRSVIKSEQT
jgi:hypothetical protein